MTTKRRIRGEGGFSQRASDGLWVGTMDLGWHAGKRVRKTVSAKTKREAQAKFVKLKAEIEKGGGAVGSASTVEAWLNYWLDNVASERVRARTLMGYRQYVNGYLIPNLGAHRLGKLREDHIRAMYRAMKDRGLSDATRRQAHAILRRALLVAEREGRISRNPAANIDPPPVGKNHRTPLSLEQARKVLASLDGNPLAARWVAALLLGMRQGECLGLKWSDVDMAAGTIHVERELLRVKDLGLILTPPKSSASVRRIPMLGPMKFALEQTERRGEFVFYGGMCDPRRDWGNWKALLIEAGVCDATMAPGDMPELAAGRTTTATLLRDAGVDVTVVRDILGHSQVQITQEFYQRTDAATMKAAMVALEAHTR
jgi:integrase